MQLKFTILTVVAISGYRQNNNGPHLCVERTNDKNEEISIISRSHPIPTEIHLPKG